MRLVRTGALRSGTGLLTVGVLERWRTNLGEPAISSMQACLWHALCSGWYP